MSPVSYLCLQWAICVSSELSIIQWAAYVLNQLTVWCLHWAIFVPNEQTIWVTSLILRPIHHWKCERKSCNDNPLIKYIFSPRRHSQYPFVYYGHLYGVTTIENLWGKTKINILNTEAPFQTNKYSLYSQCDGSTAAEKKPFIAGYPFCLNPLAVG